MSGDTRSLASFMSRLAEYAEAKVAVPIAVPVPAMMQFLDASTAYHTLSTRTAFQQWELPSSVLP